MSELRDAAAKLVAAVKAANLVVQVRLGEPQPMSDSHRRAAHAEHSRVARELERLLEHVMAEAHKVEPILSTLEEYSAAMRYPSMKDEAGKASARMVEAIDQYVKRAPAPPAKPPGEVNGWKRP